MAPKTLLVHAAGLFFLAAAACAQVTGVESPAPAPSPLPEATPVAPTPVPAAATATPGFTPVAESPVPTASPEPTVHVPPPFSVEIDLTEQRAYLLKDGRKFATSPISSGRYGHLTPAGDFSVIEKDLNHKSSLYGKIVDHSGRTVIAGADSGMSVPHGCRFVAAPMKYFMRFEGAEGMHAGVLPGYPASHGCVRMPMEKAILFYKHVTLGTPVHVFGHAPARKAERRVSVEREPRREVEPAPTARPLNFFERLFRR